MPRGLRVCILDGSLGAPGGNTSRALSGLERELFAVGASEVKRISLVSLFGDRSADAAVLETLRAEIAACDALVFGTGTYWDSWGSPMQRFLELMTPLEGRSEWLGKPAAVVVSMHSVGGKGVLSRLQGVLCTLGLSIPPMSGVAISLAARLALQAPGGREFAEDFWTEGDFGILAHNLLEAARGGRAYRAWGVDRQDPARLWFPEGDDLV